MEKNHFSRSLFGFIVKVKNFQQKANRYEARRD
jgi:hypothetical protein